MQTVIKEEDQALSMQPKPDISSPLYDYFNKSLRTQGIHVETGIFGADMKCALINDGPVTIVLDSDDIMPRK